MSHRASFGERIRFLRNLECHAVKAIRDGSVEAPDSFCEGRVAEAARQIRWLSRSLAVSELPKELSSDAFLEGIYERAAEPSLKLLDPLLREAVRPVSAPRDELLSSPSVVDPVREALQQPTELPANAADAIWASLRTEIQAHLENEPVEAPIPAIRSMAPYLLAASVLLVGLVASGIFQSPAIEQGTPGVDTAVIQFDDREFPISDHLTLPRFGSQGR